MKPFGKFVQTIDQLDDGATEFEKELHAVVKKYSEDDRILNFIVIATTNRNESEDPIANMEESPYLAVFKMNRAIPLDWAAIFRIIQSIYMPKDPVISARLVLDMAKAFIDQFEHTLQQSKQFAEEPELDTPIQAKCRAQFKEGRDKLMILLDYSIHNDLEFSYMYKLFVKFVDQKRDTDPKVTRFITETEKHSFLAPIYELESTSPGFAAAKDRLFDLFVKRYPNHADRRQDFDHCIEFRFPYGLPSCQVDLGFILQLFAEYMDSKDPATKDSATFNTVTDKTVELTNDDMDKILSKVGSDSQTH